MEELDRSRVFTRDVKRIVVKVHFSLPLYVYVSDTFAFSDFVLIDCVLIHFFIFGFSAFV